MCEIKNGVIVCASSSINPRQAGHEWLPARLKQEREDQKAALASLPADMNLIEGIQSEQARVRELLTLYQEIPTGAFGAAMLTQAIKESEDALASGDVVRQLRAYEALKNCE